MKTEGFEWKAFEKYHEMEHNFKPKQNENDCTLFKLVSLNNKITF